MQILFYLILIWISIYTFGFAVTLWKEKQKFGALATVSLCLIILILPFFSRL